jgi:hypothetical protein
VFHDENFERSANLKRGGYHVISRYRKMRQEKKLEAKQSSLDDFFRKSNWSLLEK